MKSKFLALIILAFAPILFASPLVEEDWSFDSSYYSFVDGKIVCQPSQMAFLIYRGAQFNLDEGAQVSYTFEVENSVLKNVTSFFNNIATFTVYQAPVTYFFDPKTSKFSVAFNNDTSYMPSTTLNVSDASAITTITTDFFVSEGSVFTKIAVNDILLSKGGKDSFKLADVASLTETPPCFEFNSTEGPMSVTDLSMNKIAIPEPSTYALIFGALALCIVAYRKRK